MSRGCKLCNFTGYRIWRDKAGREVSGRCRCNPEPPKPEKGKPQEKKPKAEQPRLPDAEEAGEWFR